MHERRFKYSRKRRLVLASTNTGITLQEETSNTNPVFPIAKNLDNKIESDFNQFAVVTTINELTGRCFAKMVYCHRGRSKPYESLAKKDSVFYLLPSYQN